MIPPVNSDIPGDEFLFELKFYLQNGIGIFGAESQGSALLLS